MSKTNRIADRAKDVLHEGNARHVIVEKHGRVLVDLPLTIVVIAAVLAVWLVAILAAVAVINGCEIRFEGPEKPPHNGDSPSAGD
ncbi:MAG TPA: DUF4342 domain-containing protein [Tepidiformaceae bacterium]|jgi:hypothetical protein|nr:DUF4342 domain-containing protein [Tepidiformaceae bacterium]